MTKVQSNVSHYLEKLEENPTTQLLEEIQQEVYGELSEDEKLFLESRFHLQQNNIQHAETVLSKILQKYPDDLSTHLNLAQILYKNNRLEDALQHYSTVIKLDDVNLIANQNSGNIYLMLSQYETALNYYVRVIMLTPNNIEAINNAAFCQYKLQNLSAAEVLLDKIPENKKNAYSFRLAALVAFEKKELDESSALFMKSIHLDDKNYQTWSELALTEKDRGMHENAYKCISLANGLAPTNVDYYLFKSAYGLVVDGADHREHLLSLINADIRNETKMTALSLYIQYCLKFSDIKTADQLLNYDEFIRPHTLPFSSSEKASMRDFILARNDLTFEMKGTTTKKGRQTYSLAQANHDGIHKLIQLIKEKVLNYAKDISATPSIYARLLQNKVRMKIWSVVLDEGGYQAPHMHPGGIISGCYYLNFDRESNPGVSGNIEFGNPEQQFELPVENLTKMVEVEENKLVIFPSYYFHNTFPTKSTAHRISIAFDIVPVEDGVEPEDNLTAAFELKI